MRLYQRDWREAFVLTALFSCVPGLVLCADTAAAADTATWIHDPSQAGSWLDRHNWSPRALPGDFTNVDIANGGTTCLAAGTARARHVYVDNGSTIDQSDGSFHVQEVLFLGLHADSRGSFLLSGGLAVPASVVVGRNGTGRIHITAGMLDVPRNLSLATGSGSGHVLHEGGTVSGADGSMTVGWSRDGYGHYELRGSGAIDLMDVSIGGAGSHFLQSGGTVTLREWLRIGGGENQRGVYDLTNDGRLTARQLAVAGSTGSYPAGTGVFNQRGGHVDVPVGMYVGAGKASHGTYNLIGGQLETDYLRISTYGAGLFDQQGGRLAAGWIRLDPQHDREYGDGIARYRMRGGRASADLITIYGREGTASFEQSGGNITVDELRMEGGPARYEYLGGSLRVKKKMVVEGHIDFGDQPVTLKVDPDSYVDLSAASIERAGRATFRFGHGSLLVAPPGVDIPSLFKTFTGTRFATYVKGTPLHILADQEVGLGHEVDIEDHVIVDGSVHESQHGRVNLEDGITVNASGSVDLSNRGTLLVRDTLSEIHGGDLKVARLLITPAEGSANRIRQHGGAVYVTQQLSVGLSGGAPGYYDLTGGTLSAKSIKLGHPRYSYEPTFTQTGGTVTAEELHIAADRPAKYILENGDLFTTKTVIGDGAGKFAHRSGTHIVGLAQISGDGVYRYLGGTLDIRGGLEFRNHGGMLDFANRTTRIDGSGIILGLAGGIVRSSQRASLELDEHSLLLVDPGFAPARRFHHYRNAGIKHVVGQALTIGAERVITGTGTIPDFAQVHGSLVAKAAIFLPNGVMVGPSGYVDLGMGYTEILDDAAGNAGGTLVADGMYMRTTELDPTFVHSAGTVDLGSLKLARDTRYLFTTGDLRIRRALALMRVSTGGVFDFSGGDGRVTVADGGYLDFSKGHLLNAQNASIRAGRDTLISFPAGFDLETDLGNLVTRGLVHAAGTPLHIPESTTISWEGQFSGTITNNGGVSPGSSPGLMEISGDYLQGDTGQLIIELAGTNSSDAEAMEFDVLEVAGTAELAGSLDVHLLDGFLPIPSDTFRIVKARNITGTFSNALEQVVFPNGMFDVTYASGEVLLTNFQIPEPGGLGLFALTTIAWCIGRPSGRPNRPESSRANPAS